MKSFEAELKSSKSVGNNKKAYEIIENHRKLKKSFEVLLKLQKSLGNLKKIIGDYIKS